MRILFIGDIIGRPGRDVVSNELPGLRSALAIDFVIGNGENAAGGFGLTRKVANELFATGVDVLTTGNHWADQKEILSFIDDEDRILRPLNYPAGTPGKGTGLFDTRDGRRILVVNVMGRAFMDPLDDPFAAVEKELGACPLGEGCDATVIDMHAEATSEKMAMGHFCDGRASLVIGTHTHVPTADEQILNLGTGYMTDAGMCGDYDSVLGMGKEEPLARFLTKIPNGRFQPSLGKATISGVGIDIDDATGLARAIAPLRLGGRLSQAEPAFWLPAD